MPKKFVTLYTDASFWHKMKKCAIAGRIRSDNGRTLFAIPVKKEVRDNNEAELLAITVGLKFVEEHLREHEEIEAKDLILVIKTDSRTAQNILIKRSRDDLKETYEYLAQFGQCFIKHVKGHQSTRTYAGYLNDWCDRAASENKKIFRTHSCKPNNKINLT